MKSVDDAWNGYKPWDKVTLVNYDLYSIDINSKACLEVKGIEEWITQLLPLGEYSEDCLLRVKDVDTGTIFLIRRKG